MLTSSQTPSDFTASLLGLLVPMDLVSRLVERTDRKAAKARAKDVAERGSVGDAVKAAVQQQITAIVAQRRRRGSRHRRHREPPT